MPEHRQTAHFSWTGLGLQAARARRGGGAAVLMLREAVGLVRSQRERAGGRVGWGGGGVGPVRPAAAVLEPGPAPPAAMAAPAVGRAAPGAVCIIEVDGGTGFDGNWLFTSWRRWQKDNSVGAYSLVMRQQKTACLLRYGLVILGAGGNSPSAAFVSWKSIIKKMN